MRASFDDPHIILYTNVPFILIIMMNNHSICNFVEQHRTVV